MENRAQTPVEPSKPDLSALRIDRNREEPPSTSRSLRAVLVGTLILVLVGGAVVGYRTWSSAGAAEVEVARATVESGAGGLEILTATGYVVADRKAAVSPKISGRLEYLGVDTGSVVKAGDVIARLEHRDLDADLSDARSARNSLQADLSQAEAELEQARAALAEAKANTRKSELDLARQARLLEQGVTSRADYDAAVAKAAVDEAQVKSAEALIRSARQRINSAEAQLRSAEARITAVEVRIEYTNIRAPFDGLVISKEAEVGETVAPAIFGGNITRGSVVTIIDPRTLEVEADINESSIGKISPGLPADITLDALPSEKFPGKAYKIVPTADRQKATVKVKVSFDRIDPRVLPDMSAKVTFIDRNRQSDHAGTARVTVPKSAILERSGKTVVLVVIDDRVRSQEVEVGGEFGGRVEIKQGLAGGETVVVKGADAISDDARVRAKTAG